MFCIINCQSSSTDCGKLSRPDEEKFHERNLGTHPGSKATPVCNDGFSSLSSDIQYLVCTLWGEWAAVDRETKQLKKVDWEHDKRHVMCKSKLLNSCN